MSEEIVWEDAEAKISKVADSEQSCETLRFMAIGDFGYPTDAIKKTAMAMQNHIDNGFEASFILALGDNFYPKGVDSVDDIRFKTQWEDTFLIYENLRVPWYATLGNHDYDGNPYAQIEFTDHPSNPYGGLWKMPSNNYQFSRHLHCNSNLDSELGVVSVDFFCVDTNGVQKSVRLKYPSVKQNLHDYKPVLQKQLMESQAKWKIVFGHHPMYTKGILHGILGKCLKDDRYLDGNNVEHDGYGFENTFSAAKVDAYITGHEHTFQHHEAFGVHHFVAGSVNNNLTFSLYYSLEASYVGAAGYNNRLYGGENQLTHIDWVDESHSDGFLAITITANAMSVQYISNDNAVLKEVVIAKE